VNVVKLKELSINNRGYYGIGAPAINYDKNKFVYLRITDIKDDGEINKDSLMSVEDSKASQYILEKNDIVFARTGASTGRNYFYDGEIQNMVYAGFLIKFSLNSNLVNPRYVKYYCLSPKYKDWIYSSLTGSTRPNINEKQLSEMPIELPERTYQDKVVKILDSITKKIELNNKLNNNLYEILTTLYKESLNNIKSKEEKTLDEFCNIFTGKKNANEYDEYGKNKFFTCGDKTLKINSYIYNGPAIIISGNGSYTGRTQFYNGKFDLYQRTYACTIKNDVNEDYIYALYTIVKNELVNKISGGTHGSAIPYIVMNDLAKFKIYFDDESLKKLSRQAKIILQKIQLNDEENETLSQLRDTLLPKLMNGEIDLDKIEF